MLGRGGVRRGLIPFLVAVVGLFVTSSVVLALQGEEGSSDEEAKAAPPSPAVEIPPPTTTTVADTQPPATTQPAPPPPEPEPEPEPEPAPPPASRVAGASVPRVPAPALPPAPEPPPPPAAVASANCSSLSAAGLVSLHQARGYAVDGGLTAGAQSYAIALCSANAGGNLYHSGQAAGENLGWIGASGCINDANTIFQAWLASPSHATNIDRYHAMGGGVACDGTNTYFVVQYG